MYFNKKKTNIINNKELLYTKSRSDADKSSWPAEYNYLKTE